MDDGDWDCVLIEGYVCPQLSRNEIILSRKSLPDSVEISAGSVNVCKAFLKGHNKAVSLPYNLTAEMVPLSLMSGLDKSKMTSDNYVSAQH